MKTTRRWVVAFASGLLLTTLAASANAQQALTPAQQTAAGQEGAAFGRDEHKKADDGVPEFIEGGENGAGQVKLGTRTVDVNKLSPGASKAKQDSLNDLEESGSNFDKLKEKSAARDAELQTDDGAEGKAFRTFERSAIRAKETDKSVKDDQSFWDSSMPALREGRAGNVQGSSGPTCNTTTNVETKPSSSYIEDEQTCERIKDYSDAPLCTREATETSSTVTYDQDKKALLSIDEGTSGQICRRERFVTSHQETLSQSRAGDLEITDEQSGLSCRRYRWATEVITAVTKSKDYTLAINDEMGGLSCKRERWVESTTDTVNGSRQATLGLDNQLGGLSCTRQWWPTNSVDTVNEVQDAILNINTEVDNRLACSRWIWPSNSTENRADSYETDIGLDQDGGGLSCNRWIRVNDSTGTTGGSMNATLNVNNENGGLACQRWRGVAQSTTFTGPGSVSKVGPRSLDESTVFANLDISANIPAGTTELRNFAYTLSNYTTGNCRSAIVSSQPSAANGWKVGVQVTAQRIRSCTPTFNFTWENWSTTRSYSVLESGNCADPGSASCPTQWTCTQQAPTTVSGYSVTAAEISSLAALYGGAPSACTNADLNRTCSGTSGTSNSISIAGALAAGTTTISGFNFAVSNPQTGVAVVLLQTPTAGNSWVAVFRVDRSFPSPTPSAPQITMTWNSNYPTQSATVVESGNCADPGSQLCPVRWSCTANAPTAVEGKTVTTALAASVAPLFPGAANTCAYSALNRVCDGTSTRPTSVSIAQFMPAGTTSISNFQWVVTNPNEPGVTVSLASAPTQANNWVATFNATRSAYAWGPPLPHIRMTWNTAVTTTTTTVGESGNCNDVGTQVCPTSWSCTSNAPATVNNITVTTAMAAAKAPLFPGATSSCIRGDLRSHCSVSNVTETQVSIAAKIPAGTTSISGFYFSVLNPNPGAAVSLFAYPTQANGWVATFRVTRNSFGSPVPQPQIRMTWNRAVTNTTWQLLETGNCSDSGSANCPTAWSCTQNAPATVNGVNVTTAMAQGQPLIYPNSANTCLRGELNRQCSGTAGKTTTVSIADLIPAGVTAIQNFQFTVQNPQSGVTVALTSAPTLANSWVATFNVTKTVFGSAVQEPIVNMTWSSTTTSYNWSVRDTGGSIAMRLKMMGGPSWAAMAMSSLFVGEITAATATDCTDPGSTVCPTQWSCTGAAPTTINGVSVSTGMVSGLPVLFPSATNTCVAGELRRVCSGASTVGTSISIADQIPPGATAIRDLSFQVLNPQAGVTVKLVVPPTYANGWNAGFEVARTDYSYQPQPVQIRITFTVEESSIALSVQETGNCTDPGSTACPTQWSCTQSAPTTINNQNITLAMVQNEPVLYPGATQACVTGELRRVCNGSSAISTQIPIGDLLPQDTTEITNFAWSVTNPQNQIAVSLVSAPTLQNGWVATFNVVRDYGQGGSPTKPNVLMTWNVLGPIEYDHSVITDGDCSGASDGAVSPSCRVRWRCLGGLPRQYGDISLTRGMIAGRENLRLYPEEDWDCADAVRERVCDGDGTNLTVVDISDQLPPNTTSIRNYGWDVTVPGAGVGVEQLEPPTLANGWKATFRTTRTDWSVTPTQPEVRLHWQVDVTTSGNVIQETGDCSKEGDEFCDAKWRCTENFPAANAGTLLGNGSMQVTFGPPTTSGGQDRSWSIASKLPSGTNSVANFQMQVTNTNANSIFSGVKQVPSASNGWMVVIHDSGYCSDATYANCVSNGGLSAVTFMWDSMSGTGAQQTLDPPIYAGAAPTCKKAEKYLDCSRINNGEVCHETEQGTVCENVEGGPFDNCGQYKDDPSCTYQRTVCNEDAWGGTESNPVCRIETDVYKCRREVQGEDVIVRETTVCQGELSACADGSCTANVDQEVASDSATMRKASAQLALRENMRSDFTYTGAPLASNSKARQTKMQELASVASNITDKLLGGVMSEARAQAFDPFKMPSGQDSTPSDPDQAAAAYGNYTADTMRFFDGKSYNCMKALGGLLNCCTKKVDPSKTNGEWWKAFGDNLRKKYSQNIACQVNALPGNQKDSGSAKMQGGATFDDLSKGFTGLEDMLKGGGTSPTCDSTPPRMEDVMKDFMGTMKSKYFPKLAWYCDTDEKELAAQKEVGNCTYLGDYCKRKVLGFCIDKRQRYCCFNSPMTRMIREKLRDMGIKGMGKAKKPDCSGVTPAQFASMNTEDMNTGDLEGRMLAGGMFPDLASLLGSAGLLEMWTGTGSNINNDRVNSLDRTNTQLDGTNPGAAVASIDELMSGVVPANPTTTTATPGNVSFTTGFRSVSHGTLPEKQVQIGVIRNGGQGSVGVTVVAVSGTASAGSDFTFAPQTLTWGNGDRSEKNVVLVVKKAGRTEAVTLELRLQQPTNGAAISPTEVMQVQIQPSN